MFGLQSAPEIKLIDYDSDFEDDGPAASDVITRIVFHIYGLSQSVIDEVIREIDDIGKDAITDKVLDSPEEQAQIAKLSDTQVSVYLLALK